MQKVGRADYVCSTDDGASTVRNGGRKLISAVLIAGSLNVSPTSAAPAAPVPPAAATTSAAGVAPATPDVPARAPAELYKAHCAACHEGGVPRAPHSVKFQMLGPRAILAALEHGVMQTQGAALTAAERRSLAEFLGGAALADANAAVPRCDARRATFDVNRPPPLSGWGMTLEGTRFAGAEHAKLSAADVPRLELQWAFAFPGASRARSQPTVGAGAVFVGSQDGTVYALDFESGCVRWTFQADAEVRTSPTLEPWRRGDRGAQPRLWFGDFNGNAYALDARTGRLLWKQRVDEHPRLTLTGSPRYYDGRLYVPMSSSEWAAAADPAYECCTFRGGVVALDARTGQVVWRSYTIPEEPRATGEKNSAGALRRHPAGAPVWNSPTIDVQRRRLYVGTGEAYTSPAAPQSDSVIAYDLDTGRMLWWHQSLPNDAWNMACFIGGGPNCPRENGPDLDIGAPPVLHRLPDGRDVLLVGQKSADVFALDPDTGKLLWKVRYGRGGFAGGVHWGLAASATTLYAPNADTTFLGTEKGEPKPGLYALEPASGAIKWFAPAPKDSCKPETKPACDPGYSPPPTVIPGVVFQPAFDGWLRAYRESDGALLWSFDTVRQYDAVGGLKGQGGSIESAGAIVADGAVLVNSGYLFGGRMPGNVLLKFAAGGR
jgi:polyvinyl alcohol dehydrogenase (cytochrome)